MGHFVSWVVEIIIFGVLGHIIQANSLAIGNWLFIVVFTPSINYVIFPAVQAITSQDLRNHVFNIQCFKDNCLCVNCKFKLCESNAAADEGPEQIELHVMQNGNAHHM